MPGLRNVFLTETATIPHFIWVGGGSPTGEGVGSYLVRKLIAYLRNFLSHISISNVLLINSRISTS